jgi:serine protease Do
VNAKLLLPALLAVGLASKLPAAQNLESTYRKNGETVVSAFEAQRSVIQQSSAVVRDGGNNLVYGTIVSADGYILTKASEIRSISTPTVLVGSKRYNARVMGVDPVWDVALLKIEASDLVPVIYTTDEDIPQGTWVVANGSTSNLQRRVMAGIISAKPREIPASGGAALGVVLKKVSKHLEIESVNEKGGSREAGLEKGDILLSLDGKKVSKLEELAECLKDKKAGSTVKVGYRRDGKDGEVDVRLVARGEMTDEKSRNDQMSGEVSSRRTGFPRVIQHDILGNNRTMGGPVIDLNGRCVGMNIARADRTQTFAIPADDLQKLAERLIKAAANP